MQVMPGWHVTNLHMFINGDGALVHVVITLKHLPHLGKTGFSPMVETPA